MNDLGFPEGLFSELSFPDNIAFLLTSYRNKGYKTISKIAGVETKKLEEFFKFLGSQSKSTTKLSMADIRIYHWKDFDAVTIVAYELEEEWLQSTDSYVTTDNATITIYIATPDGYDVVESIERIIQASELVETHKDRSSRVITMVSCDEAGTVTQVDKGISIDALDKVYAGLYPGIDIELLAHYYMAAPDSLLLLYGIPGVGKTTFLRYLALKCSLPGKIYYAKDDELLASDRFWALIQSSEDCMLILDDISPSMKNRSKSSDKRFVEQLLSVSNSIFEINPKIVIATNQELVDIEPALMRPGRCYDRIELEPLTLEQAIEIWPTLPTVNDIPFPANLRKQEVITQAELTSMVSHLVSEGAERPYLKKDSISLRRSKNAFQLPA